MLPDPTVQLPASLLALLVTFRPLFTAPSFGTFCGLAAGFLAQPGRRTVCGMLTGAGLSRLWSHHRAHRFFSHARWNSEQLGLVLARLVVALLVPAGQPVLAAMDDTLFRRTGRKVHAIGWFHDGSAKGPHQVGLGCNWVICAIIVRLPFLSRPVALPVLARLVHKDIQPAPASRLALARQMTSELAAALPGRDLHVVADAAYAGKELRRLPQHVTWTTRMRKDAALFELPPPRRAGQRGRPKVKGKRLPRPGALAGTVTFAPVTVTRYGTTATIQAAALTCLWHGAFGARPVQVILLRDKATTGYDLALATTDLAATPAQVIERYASRWSIEVAIEDAKQLFGAGEARNRLAAAVHRTVPFTLACQSLAMLWYATAGHDPADADEHRARAPWYRTKAEPSAADMIAKLRRVIIAARYKLAHPLEPTPDEIRVLRLAWEEAAA
jgi:DDE superfamily endonuclease